MLAKIIKNVFTNFQTFLVTWVVILIANQLFIFGACFAPYCLIAGLPHTGVIAALLTSFTVSAQKEKERQDNEANKSKKLTLNEGGKEGQVSAKSTYAEAELDVATRIENAKAKLALLESELELIKSGADAKTSFKAGIITGDKAVSAVYMDEMQKSIDELYKDLLARHVANKK